MTPAVTGPTPPTNPYVSRGGLKLRHALERFGLSPAGLRCVDVGCSTGGFTDCLLQAGAAHVTAIDTGYGVIAWKLRTDPRVTVLERTNALHAQPPGGTPDADLIVIDAGWTPQSRIIPAALRWLRPDPGARIISLIKPHYELSPAEKSRDLVRGVLPDDAAERIARRTADALPALGVRVLGLESSPIRGSGAGTEGHGNIEWLALIARA